MTNARKNLRSSEYKSTGGKFVGKHSWKNMKKLGTYSSRKVIFAHKGIKVTSHVDALTPTDEFENYEMDVEEENTINPFPMCYYYILCICIVRHALYTGNTDFLQSLFCAMHL